MFKNKITILLIVLVTVIFLLVSLENAEINKFSDPTKVGNTFSHFLLIRDNRSKEVLKYFSDGKLHSKIESLKHESEPTYLSEYKIEDDKFYLSGFKRSGDVVVATYTLFLKNQKAWHSTVVLSLSTAETSWQKFKRRRPAGAG